jgi:hypothetical protein
VYFVTESLTHMKTSSDLFPSRLSWPDIICSLINRAMVTTAAGLAALSGSSAAPACPGIRPFGTRTWLGTAVGRLAFAIVIRLMRSDHRMEETAPMTGRNLEMRAHRALNDRVQTMCLVAPMATREL